MSITTILVTAALMIFGFRYAIGLLVDRLDPTRGSLR